MPKLGSNMLTTSGSFVILADLMNIEVLRLLAKLNDVCLSGTRVVSGADTVSEHMLELSLSRARAGPPTIN